MFDKILISKDELYHFIINLAFKMLESNLNIWFLFFLYLKFKNEIF